MISTARRLGIAATAVGIALAGLVAGSGTAGATVKKTCFVTGGFIPFPLSSSTPAELHAWLQRECTSPESVTPLPVYIQRLNTDGTWTTVASGTGEATYVCHFSTTRVYRWTQGSGSGVPFNCG